MSRHVDHLLAAYVDGQLTNRDTARVYNHLRGCQPCRDRLTTYERLSDDLKLVLNDRPQASRGDVDRWWAGIAAARVQPSRPSRVLVFAPALLVVVVLGLPLVTALTSLSPRSARTSAFVENMTASVPPGTDLPVAGLIPQPGRFDRTTTVVATAAPQENAATAAPAPLAPSVQ